MKNLNEKTNQFENNDYNIDFKFENEELNRLKNEANDVVLSIYNMNAYILMENLKTNYDPNIDEGDTLYWAGYESLNDFMYESLVYEPVLDAIYDFFKKIDAKIEHLSFIYEDLHTTFDVYPENEMREMVIDLIKEYLNLKEEMFYDVNETQMYYEEYLEKLKLKVIL